MIVSFVGDIDASMHGLKDLQQQRRRSKANLNKIDLHTLTYDQSEMKDNFNELVHLCKELSDSNEIVYLTNLLRILYHYCRKDVKMLKNALGIEGLCDLIPERTKDNESNGTSPEFLAMRCRNCRIMKTCFENGVKANSYYIVNTENK